MVPQAAQAIEDPASVSIQMDIHAWLKDFVIGSRDNTFRVPPDLTSFELMKIGLRELAESHKVVGCSAIEVARLESQFSVALPPTYRTFLETVGHDAGPFLRGEDYSYSRLGAMREMAVELLVESGAEFRLELQHFVFFMHQGYQFAFFPTEPAVEDPPVFYYLENERQPRLDANCFTEWMVHQLLQGDDGPPWLRSMPKP